MPFVESYLANTMLAVIGSGTLFFKVDHANNYKMSKSLAYNALWGACCIKECYHSTIPPFIESFSPEETIFSIKCILNGEEIDSIEFNDKNDVKDYIIPQCDFIFFIDNSNKENRLISRFSYTDKDWNSGEEWQNTLLAVEIEYKGVTCIFEYLN